ncbi:MAG: MFS transporter [Actinobacteria bacterium]|nr:MAG: MFS transporter [Actinomycetota bacterium]
MSFKLFSVPSTATPDGQKLVATRSVRALVDGMVYVSLPGFLLALGLSGLQIGAVVTASLLGSAIATIMVGIFGHRIAPARLLAMAALLMTLTGIAFGLASSFVLILIIGVIGTMNPSAGDVSAFLPLEQASLSASVTDDQRTAMFALYNLSGALVGSIGALCAALPLWFVHRQQLSDLFGYRITFFVYAFAGLIVFAIYRRMSVSAQAKPTGTKSALGDSRRVIFKLAALFSLDSFGGGFAVQSIFGLWIFRRFDLSISALGVVFFATGTLSAISSLLSVRIAKRIGLVRTMVFTHIPASVLLIGVALSPNVWLAVTLFILRGLLSQMDVPVRVSYVMAVVQPSERAAAASVTNVPRSLASALPPIAAGWMLDHSRFAWPLLICAACKIIYDFLLLWQFRHIRPPEEQ